MAPGRRASRRRGGFVQRTRRKRPYADRVRTRHRPRGRLRPGAWLRFESSHPGGEHLPAPDDHALAANLAERAGQLLLDLRAAGGEPDTLRKAGDRQSHEFLMAELAKARPADAVLSEEGIDDQARLTADRVWIVDPLDGTREFGEPGRPDWAVHVALWERAAPGASGDAGAAGELTAGAVALPAQGITLSTLNAAERADRRGDSSWPSAGVPAGTSPSGSGAQRPLRMVVSRTRASQLVKDVAGIF